MITNMNLGKKLMAAFLGVAAVALLIGAVGYYGAVRSQKAINEVGGVRLPSIQSIQTINEAQTAVWVSERGLTNRQMLEPELRKSIYTYVDDAFKRADEAWKVYELLPQTEEEAQLWKEFVPKWETWKKEFQAVRSISEETDKLLAAGVPQTDSRVEELLNKAFEASRSSRLLS